MGKYFVKRVLLLIPTILLVCIIVFALMRMIPMDAVATLQQKLSANGNYVDEEYVKSLLGLDRPAGEQFFIWIGNVFKGDLGSSYFDHVTVNSILAKKLPATLELGILSLIITNAYIDYPDVDSAQLTTVAFKVAYGKFGGYFMAIAIAIFAWTTIIGMYYSCEKSVNYAFGDTKANRRATWVYMVYYMLPCVLFYNIEADTLWAMTDLLSAIYVIITLLFIYSKQREIFRLFHDFWDRFVPAQERGENPEPVVYGTVDEKAKGEF